MPILWQRTRQMGVLDQPAGLFFRGRGITHSLGEYNLLILPESHGLGQGLSVHPAANHRGEAFGRTEQIDILAYEACVGRRVEVFVGLRAARHPGIIRHEDKIHRGARHEILTTGHGSDIVPRNHLEVVLLRSEAIEAFGKRNIDVDLLEVHR